MLGPNSFSLSSGQRSEGGGRGFRMNCVYLLTRKGGKARRFDFVCPSRRNGGAVKLSVCVSR
jgi:hypothetical protein